MFTKAFVLLVVGACLANGQRAGGNSGVNPNDPDIRNLLEKAIDSENGKTNAEPQELVEVLSATKQVVSGSMYTITYVSQGIYSGNRIQCQIKLHDQPWIRQTPTVVNNQCVPA